MHKRRREDSPMGSVPATGGEPGEAHGVSRLQLGVGQVAAVQLGRPGSSAGAQAAPRSVQRLPHAGLRLRAALHSGKQPEATPTPAVGRSIHILYLSKSMGICVILIQLLH